MLIIVSDSSSLILLEKICLLKILTETELNFIIPLEVKKESVDRGKEKNYADAFKLENKINKGVINVKEVKNRSIVNKLMEDFNINKGESEAIALFLQKKSDLLATDDRLAINACNALGVPSSGTLAFVLKSFDKKLISKKEALNMIEKASKYGRY